MIILPCDGSMSILFKRDIVDQTGDNGFSLYYPKDQTLTLAATKRILLYNAMVLLGAGTDEEPVWVDESLRACWKGEKGTKCALYKPFYDTADLIANPDRNPDYFERNNLPIPISHPIPFHLLTGITGEAPEEYPIIYDLVLRTVQDYAGRPYPWLLAVRQFPDENRHVFYVSRTSALFCALKLLEMTFNDSDPRCEVDGVVRFFRLEEGAEDEWVSLGVDEVEQKLGAIR